MTQTILVQKKSHTNYDMQELILTILGKGKKNSPKAIISVGIRKNANQDNNKVLFSSI